MSPTSYQAAPPRDQRSKKSRHSRVNGHECKDNHTQRWWHELRNKKPQRSRTQEREKTIKSHATIHLIRKISEKSRGRIAKRTARTTIEMCARNSETEKMTKIIRLFFLLLDRYQHRKMLDELVILALSSYRQVTGIKSQHRRSHEYL